MSGLREILLAALVLLAAPAGAQETQPPDPFQPRKLATIPDDVALPEFYELASVGAGGSRVVWTKIVPPKQSVVVLDGTACKPIEGHGQIRHQLHAPAALLPWISNLPGSVWSADGKHVAWHGVRGNKRILIVDGVEGDAWDEIKGALVEFSDDWSRIGYAARDGNKSFAVVNGKKSGEEFDEVLWVSISANGTRFGYQARLGKKYVVVVDDRVVEGTYLEFRGPWFSPDGKRVAYMGRTDKGEHLVVDGVEGPRYDVVYFLMFSPDGRRLAYRAKLGDRWHVVVDGVQGPAFDEFEGYSFTFSPDSRRTAYAADHHLVLDGKVQPKTDTLFAHLTFSPDGTRLGYFRRMDLGGHQLVVDGVPFASGSDHLTFSPSGRHVAATEQRRIVVVDRNLGPKFDAVLGPPVFSPDERKVAYPVRQGREILWKVDDVK